VKTKTIILILSIALNLNGQPPQIGQWKDYLPYNNAIALAEMNEQIYVCTENNLFLLNKNDEFISRLTTTNGLSDVGVNCMKKDLESNTLVIAYKSCKIDIIKDNNIQSLLDIERENIVGGKSINNISFYSGKCYLSCSFGIIELDIEKFEVTNTFYLSSDGNISVNDISFLGDSIYAATDSGLFAAKSNDNLLDFRSWKKRISNESITKMESIYEKIYFTTNSSTNIHAYDGSGWSIICAVENLRFIKKSNGRFFVGAQGILYELPEDHKLSAIKESSFLYKITDVLLDENNFWLTDEYRGLVKIDKELNVSTYQPNGPISNLAYSTIVVNENVFLSHGGTTILWNNNNTRQGISWHNGYDWHNIPYTNLGGAVDITNIIKGRNNKVYVGTWNNGLLELEYNSLSDAYLMIKEHNYFSTNGSLEAISTDATSGEYGWIRIMGMALDNNDLLWVTSSEVDKGLAFMNADNNWTSLNIASYDTKNVSLGDLIIDNQGKKWFYVAKGGGLLVYDDNNTPDNPGDDNDKHLNTNVGSGNLPSNNIYSLAKDRDGEIWVGTDKGVAVFYNTENVFGLDGDAQLVLVEADGYIEPIISNETVTSIAIDGANRKWLGTKSSGVFVYSADGSEQIMRFNEENSPLFSNTINNININQKSGEVLICTDKGLISYMGQATERPGHNTPVLVYPNPVKEDYFGPIAIKNVIENADVKITDIAGNLIQSLTAYGGQAIWDGNNKYGQRASTGIYLVFTTNSNGTETNVSKILFIK